MIKRLLRWLWCPGPCSWETIKVTKVFEDPEDELAVFTKYTLRCKTCGDIRTVRS